MYRNKHHKKMHVQTNGAPLQNVGVAAGGDASAEQLQPAVVGHFGQRSRGVAQIGNQGRDVVHRLVKSGVVYVLVVGVSVGNVRSTCIIVLLLAMISVYMY